MLWCPQVNPHPKADGGRPCFSTVFAGQSVGLKAVEEGIWLASFMDYGLGYVDLEERTLQPLDNPFGPKSDVTHVSGPDLDEQPET